MSNAPDDQPARRTLGEHALDYATAGLAVFPVEPKGPKAKAPIGRLAPNGMKDATVDLDIIRGWWTRRPDALIGHRITRGVVLLDIDPKHGGHETWRALRAQHGADLLTRVHYSGRNDGGGHVWLALNLDAGQRLSIVAIDRFAEEHGHGAKLKSKWTGGIDLLSHDHRYTILPPSPHPDTGAPYDWRGRYDSPIAEAPAWLADLIVEDVPLPPPVKAPTTDAGDSIADWYTANSSWTTILGRHGWTCVRGDGDQDGSAWRHPQATNTRSATIRHGCLFVFTSSTAFEETTDGAAHGYTRFAAHALLDHAGDQSAAARAAREAKDGPAVKPDLGLDHLTFGTLDEGGTVVEVAAPPPPATVNLPPDFWTARPFLTAIRDAAWNRAIAPDAVLGAALARTSAYLDHRYELPPVVGSPASLNFYAAIIAPSGTGKTLAQDVAAELVTRPPMLDVLDDLPLGSGEGIAEAYMGEEPEEQENGKTKLVRKQVRHNAFISIDEGAAITNMMERSGATVLESLRRGWSGATLGQANASAERRRIVPRGTYRLGLVVAFQPELAGRLLADVKAGTPQRFLFLSAIDPTIPDDAPEWPQAIRPPSPSIHARAAHEVTAQGLRRLRLGIDDTIAADLRAAHKAKSRGHLKVDELNSHEPVHRLKLAGLFALLDDRLDITLDDWTLADTVWRTSMAVRASVIASVAAEEARAADARTLARATSEAVVEVHRAGASDKVRRLADRLARAVAKATAEGELDAGATLGWLNRKVAGHERLLVEAAIAEAERADTLTESSEGRWSVGPRRLA